MYLFFSTRSIQNLFDYFLSTRICLPKPFTTLRCCPDTWSNWPPCHYPAWS